MANLGTFASDLGRAGMIIALTLIVLATFLNVGSSTTESNSAINAIISAIGDIPTWIAILVVVAMAAVVMAAFGGKKR